MYNQIQHTCKLCGQCFPVLCTYCQTPVMDPDTIYAAENGKNYSSCISCYQTFWLHCPFCRRRKENENNEASQGGNTGQGGTGQTFKGHAVCMKCRQVSCICHIPEVGETNIEYVEPPPPPALCPRCGQEICICPYCPRCGMIDCVCPPCPRCGMVDCICVRCPRCGQVDCVCSRCPRCGQVDCVCPPVCPRCGYYQSYCQCPPEGPGLPEGYCHRCGRVPCQCPPQGPHLPHNYCPRCGHVPCKCIPPTQGPRFRCPRCKRLQTQCVCREGFKRPGGPRFRTPLAIGLGAAAIGAVLYFSDFGGDGNRTFSANTNVHNRHGTTHEVGNTTYFFTGGANLYKFKTNSNDYPELFAKDEDFHANGVWVDNNTHYFVNDYVFYLKRDNEWAQGKSLYHYYLASLYLDRGHQADYKDIVLSTIASDGKNLYGLIKNSQTDFSIVDFEGTPSWQYRIGNSLDISLKDPDIDICDRQFMVLDGKAYVLVKRKIPECDIWLRGSYVAYDIKTGQELSRIDVGREASGQSLAGNKDALFYVREVERGEWNNFAIFMLRDGKETILFESENSIFNMWLDGSMLYFVAIAGNDDYSLLRMNIITGRDPKDFILERIHFPEMMWSSFKNTSVTGDWIAEGRSLFRIKNDIISEWLVAGNSREKVMIPLKFSQIKR